MFSLTALIITAAIAAIAGAAIGALLIRNSSAAQDNRELENRLQQAESKLLDYQQEVTEHFAKTAELVNDLTQSYKDVHEHLANSALHLSNADVSRAFLLNAADDSEPAISEETIEPPRDWASSSGTLSESYGLDEERDDIATRTANPVN